MLAEVLNKAKLDTKDAVDKFEKKLTDRGVNKLSLGQFVVIRLTILGLHLHTFKYYFVF